MDEAIRGSTGTVRGAVVVAADPDHPDGRRGYGAVRDRRPPAGVRPPDAVVLPAVDQDTTPAEGT